MTEALEMLHRSTDGHAIFEIGDTPYYVQMLLEENEATGWRRVLMEAVSNDYLYDHWPISPEQEAALARLGWREPFSVCSPPTICSLDHGNWHRFVSVDDLVGPVVPAMVLAALGVYGAGEGSWLNTSYYCSAGIKGTPSCS